VEEEPFEYPVVTYRDRAGIHTVLLEAGGLWHVEVEGFRQDEHTYFLSWNEKFPYVGIERFLGNAHRGNLFLSKNESIEDVLGKRGLNLKPVTMAKKLARYLVDRGGGHEKETRNA
jgi:hypothetical protein